MRPPGSLVSLYFDGRSLDVGDVLFTQTGRCYRIESVRVQERGKHVGRQHLAATVLPEHVADLPVDVRRVPIEWYPRPRRRR